MKFVSINTPNYSKKSRNSKEIKLIVIHYTGMQSRIASIKRLSSLKHKVSCHYLIDRNGEIFKMVEENKVAWHAGKSKWKNFINLNKNSIGIELVNKGHEFGYEKFTNLQIKKLIKLCLVLKKKYKIKNSNIVGHSDIAPFRKTDPGEKFPWRRLRKNRLGIW
jgi:N-acetylmuramoyl-L-alanine amidase